MTERQFIRAIASLISQARTQPWGSYERLAGLLLEGFTEVAGAILQGQGLLPADPQERRSAVLRLANGYFQGAHGSY